MVCVKLLASQKGRDASRLAILSFASSEQWVRDLLADNLVYDCSLAFVGDSQGGTQGYVEWLASRAARDASRFVVGCFASPEQYYAVMCVGEPQCGTQGYVTVHHAPSYSLVQ